MKIIKFFLQYFRFFLFNEYREKQLSLYVSREIKNLIKDKKELKILDFGSGMNPIVIKLIYSNIISKHNHIKLNIDCYDFYTDKQISILNKELDNISFYKLSELNKVSNNYDFALILDVLHHVGINDTEKISNIINNLSRISKFIIIKDHFCNNFFSKIILIIMDFIGNFYNNVNIPKLYFTEKIYNEILKNNNMLEIKRLTNYYYYKKYWLFFTNPNLHFISIFTCEKSNHINK